MQAEDMIRQARSQVMESAIAFDILLNELIAEYFVGDREKREFLAFEVLPLLPVSQRIDVLANLPLGDKGLALGKRYPRLINRLKLLNNYRNILVHGYPSTWGKARIWKGRGKMKPYPINKRLIDNMEKLSETTFESLARLFSRMLKRTSKTSTKTAL